MDMKRAGNLNELVTALNQCQGKELQRVKCIPGGIEIEFATHGYGTAIVYLSGAEQEAPKQVQIESDEQPEVVEVSATEPEVKRRGRPFTKRRGRPFTKR